MRLRSLTSLKPLKRVIDRENTKQIVTEIYINNDGEEYTRELNIF